MHAGALSHPCHSLFPRDKMEPYSMSTTAESESQLAGSLQHLIQSGIEVAQFREVAGDLEDAFLSVAARSK